MDQIICAWSTYKGSHCKKIISNSNSKNSTELGLFKFCNLHRELIIDYSKVKNNDLCETFREIKVIPRSYKHIKSIMNSMNNEDDNIQVYLSGGSVEDANISNSDYIVLDSDSSKFFYNPLRGQNKAKDLKIIFRDYCKNTSVVSLGSQLLCKECYEKLKDVPRISLIV